MEVKDAQIVQPSVLGLSKKTGYPISQHNGQRNYGPHPEDAHLSVPGKGCEIFVGKIPRDLYEDELVPVFESVGKIYRVRLMMDFDGRNRGYCFVTYFNPCFIFKSCLNHKKIVHLN